MYGYVPERIYELIKNDTDFQTIQTFLGTHKINMTSFKEIIESDTNIDNDTKEVYITTFMDVVKKLAPNYVTQMEVVLYDKTKDELKKIYAQTDLDSETKLFVLSNLINVSYIDHQGLEDYQEAYVILYESLSSADKQALSSYAHLKYLYVSIYTYGATVDTTNDKFVPTTVTFVKNKLTECSKYGISTDTINNDFIQCVNDLIHQLLYTTTNDGYVLKFILDITEYIESLDYQYKDYSYSYVKFLDHTFNLYFATRDFNNVYATLEKSVAYIDNSLKDLTTLFRGLNFYDKCEHASFLVIIRKYLKLSSSIIALKDLKFSNLSKADKELALADELTSIGNCPSTTYYYIIKNYVEHVDNWLKGNSDMFIILNWSDEG